MGERIQRFVHLSSVEQRIAQVVMCFHPLRAQPRSLPKAFRGRGKFIAITRHAGGCEPGARQVGLAGYGSIVGRRGFRATSHRGQSIA